MIDLGVLEAHGLFNGPLFSALSEKNIFNQPNINKFLELGKNYWHEARVTIQNLFAKGDTTLQNIHFKDSFTYDCKSAKMLLPIKIGDYTDFFSSKNHA